MLFFRTQGVIIIYILGSTHIFLLPPRGMWYLILVTLLGKQKIGILPTMCHNQSKCPAYKLPNLVQVLRHAVEKAEDSDLGRAHITNPDYNTPLSSGSHFLFLC